MPEMPASVRVALWVTHAWSGAMPLAGALQRALPDVDHVEGLVEQLRVWHDLGEGALLVALPSPGDVTGLPRTGPVALQDAVDGGEAVFVPGIGGMLVPHGSTFGSLGAQGYRLDWMAHEADPVPTHRIEALDPGELERRLQQAVRAATLEGERLGGQPFAGEMAREVADARLGGDWALPDSLGERARRVIVSAGTAAVVAELGLHQPDGALDAATRSARDAVLRRLGREADSVLAEVTNAACAAMAGWVPAR